MKRIIYSSSDNGRPVQLSSTTRIYKDEYCTGEEIRRAFSVGFSRRLLNDFGVDHIIIEDISPDGDIQFEKSSGLYHIPYDLQISGNGRTTDAWIEVWQDDEGRYVKNPYPMTDDNSVEYILHELTD